MLSDPSTGNVLVVSDDRETGERLGRWIAAVGERPVTLSGTEKFLLDSEDEEIVDLVVTHLDTGDPAGLSLLRRLIAGELLSGVPQLHLFRDPGLRETMIARNPSLELCSMGATPEVGELQARVRLASEIGRLRRELSRTSIRDPMTGLFNRRYLIHRLEEEFARARRYRWVLSVVLFDVDQLRKINASHGQQVGDAVIRLVGEVLQSRVRKEDVVGRAGEESFGVVLGNNHYRGAAVFASNVRTEIDERRRQIDKLARVYHVAIEKVELEGNPIDVVVKLSAEFDLVVLPYQRRRSSSLTRPDVGQNLLHQVRCSALVMPT